MYHIRDIGCLFTSLLGMTCHSLELLQIGPFFDTSISPTGGMANMAKRLRLDRVTGAAIMRLRTQAGVSQETLAKRLKIGVPTISKMESGRPPDSVDIKMIADYFGVSTDEVVGRRATPIHRPEEEIVRLGLDAVQSGAGSVEAYIAKSIAELSRKVEAQSHELTSLRKKRR